MKKYSILDNDNTKVLPKEKLIEMFKKLNELNEDSFEYKQLLDEIVLHNIRLIPTFGKQYLTKIELDDLISIGYPGLVKAVKGYDFNSNVPFPSYAKWWIQTELKRNAYMEYSPFTMSKRESELLSKFYMYLAKYEEENNKEADIEEVLGMLELTKKQESFLRLAIGLNVSTILDNQIDSDNEVTLLDRLSCYDSNPYSGTTIIKNILTDNEYDILMAKSEGYSITQIASVFHMDINEAKKKVKDIISKVSNNDVLDALRGSSILY